MKNWQKTIVTLAAIVYLDNNLIPWVGHYINHAKDYVKCGMYYGRKSGLTGIKEWYKDLLDACKRQEES